MEELLRRRAGVRELIEAFRESDRQPFPRWPERVVLADRARPLPLM